VLECKVSEKDPGWRFQKYRWTEEGNVTQHTSSENYQDGPDGYSKRKVRTILTVGQPDSINTQGINKQYQPSY